MDTPTFAEQIVKGFIGPALAASDWREKWKSVNRAAGVIVGVAIGEPYPVKEAEGYVEDVEFLLFDERRLDGDPALLQQLTDGLRKRVAEIMILMEVESCQRAR